MKNFTKSILKMTGIIDPSFEELISPTVSKQAADLLLNHVDEEGMLFIDMGSNIGQGFSFFSKFYTPNVFDYWLIEANPHCINRLCKHVSKSYKQHRWAGEWKVINAAISNKNGVLDLYGLVEDKRGKTSQGASVIKDHNSVYYASEPEQSIQVEAICISDLIQEALARYGTIVVKMDIESSEYDALEKLIEDDLIDQIDLYYVEWHSRYFSEEKREEVVRREAVIRRTISHKLTDWH